MGFWLYVFGFIDLINNVNVGLICWSVFIYVGMNIRVWVRNFWNYNLKYFSKDVLCCGVCWMLIVIYNIYNFILIEVMRN